MDSNSSPKVIIIGGGVAGLSAAHELLKRGFRVTIVEKNPKYFGGKARSIPQQPENADFCLPAEHGFRFFPGFYGNITQAMKEIPLANGKSVYDNLVPVSYYTFLFTDGRKPVDVPLNIGRNLFVKGRKLIRELRALIKAFNDGSIDITKEGRENFTRAVFQLYTSCEERFMFEYERIPWQEFIEAEKPQYGKDYKLLLAEGLTKNLVACHADKASTRTGGKILALMLWQILNPLLGEADRVLNAPTNEAWLIPWVDFLKKKYGEKLEIITGERVIKLEIVPQKLKGEKDSLDYITYDYKDGERRSKPVAIKADYYIAAIPIERLHSMIEDRSDDIYRIDPTLRLLPRLAEHIEWMSGIVFYLNRDLNIANGHITITDSPWAITMISQTPYWKDYLREKPLPEFKGQKIRTVLSVVVSNWDAEGILYPGLTVKQMSFDQIKKEVWAQIEKCVFFDLKTKQPFCLKEADCCHELTFLDDSIVVNYKDPSRLFNKEPLLVNSVTTHSLRPDAHTRLDNFFLASDYVKTNSDLADMDTANEAAKRAVNGILLQEGKRGFCKTATYALPSVLGLFALARKMDERNFRRGLPWRPFNPLYHFLNYSYLFLTYIIRLPLILAIPAFILYALFSGVVLIINFIILIIVSLIRLI
ncbi:MAG: FAD-dependent oxidoreductase [Chitinophagaceae bacterium]|nr:FAD-dependent oxidoreductase [Chitinophagaceae bacterium]